MDEITKTEFEKLQKAIFARDTAAVSNIINADEEDVLSKRDKVTGATALHYAAYVGNCENIRILAENGATLDAINFNEETPLHIACARRKCEAVEYLLDAGAYNCPLSSMRWSPLHCCALHDAVDCAELLNLNVHQINDKDIHGETALHIACFYGNYSMVKWLLAHQADLELPDNLGRLPIHLAFAAGCYAIIDALLMRSMSSLNEMDYNARTVYHYACRATIKQSTIIHLLRILEIQKSKNISPWSTDINNAPPILHALENHKTKVAKYLLGAISGKSQYNLFKTLLYSVSIDQSSSFFNYLRKNMPEDILFMADDYGYTPLHYAAEYDREDRVLCLVSMDSDWVNAMNNAGMTPLHVAAYCGKIYPTEILVNNGAFMDICDNLGCTPLMLATKSENGTACVEFLVKDIDCPLTMADIDGNSALHLACIHDNAASAFAIYEALEERNELATVLSQKNKKQETLLHLAIKMSSSVMIQLLIGQMTGSLFERDNKGRFPLFAMIEEPQMLENMRLMLMECVKVGRTVKLDSSDLSPTDDNDDDDSSVDDSD